MGTKDDLESPSSEEPSSLGRGESSSAISLRSTVDFEAPATRYFDDDPDELNTDDLPPLYSDLDDTYNGNSPHRQDSHTSRSRSFVPSNPLDPATNPDLKVQPFYTNSDEESYYVDRRLSTDPEFLQEQVQILAKIPPRPFVHIKGYHRVQRKQSSENRSNKQEDKTVIDFDLYIELTSLLYEDARTLKSWSSLRTVNHFEKVRRGTVLRTRAPGFGGRGPRGQTLSGLAQEEDGPPTVKEWCHRFCASHAGLKTFVLERRVTGWDNDSLRSRLEGMIRRTNYRGSLTIDFPVRNAKVEVYNECRTNRWRLTRWIQVVFAFTLLFIFSWPYLFLRTKKFETVYAEWPMSSDGDSRTAAERGQRGEEHPRPKKYASMSEERWYNLWARAVQKAVLDRRQGTLNQGDLARAEGRGSGGTGGEGQGNGWIEQARRGLEAMGTVDRTFGWGQDE